MNPVSNGHKSNPIDLNVVTNETCRMSWFLIETENNGVQSEQKNHSKYSIIHAVDLVDGDLNNVYINRIVKFNRNHALLEGKVILASDNRHFIETQLTIMQTAEGETSTLERGGEQHFLVQYNKGTHNIIHAIVHEKEICWPIGDLTNQREVLIRDGKVQRLAKVLYSHECESIVMDELQQLKKRCFDVAFDEDDEEMEMVGSSGDAQWLLVQYSCSTSNVIYAIVNFNNTVLQDKNWHKDVVAYLSDGTAIYQSIVLRKTNNRNELDAELAHLKNTCISAQYPLGDKQDELRETFIKLKHKRSLSKSVDSIQLECTEPDADNHLSYEMQMLEEMEMQMQREANMIADAFEAIDHTRRKMEKRLTLLNSI